MAATPTARPAVSVVIPTYRRAATIEAVIRSVLAQTLDDLEIVVVDDASGDDTPAIVAGIDDDRIRCVSHETNRGGNAARATGIAQSRGEYIAFLDSDDTWLPTKLERQLQLLREKGSEYGFCTTWYATFTPEGERLFDRRPVLDGRAVPDLLVANPIGGYSSVVVARDLLQRVGGPDVTLRACQDWDLYLRLNEVTSVCVVPEELVRYRLDPDDPVRISTRRDAVTSGHRHVYAMVRRRPSELDREQRAHLLRNFMQTFANVGSVQGVLTTWRDVTPGVVSVPFVRFGVRQLLRAAKNHVVMGERTREFSSSRR